MDRIEWQDAYLIGIELIDYQHKKLFELTNLFIETIQAVKIQNLAESMLNGLMLYAGMHVAAEETYMQRMDYPELAAHQAKHQEFLLYVKQMTERWKAQDSVDLLKSAVFIKKWLGEHILTEDMKIGTYRKEHVVHN